MSTPPGWFPNPTNNEEEVYWDGEKWTGDVRPVYTSAGDLRPSLAGTDDSTPRADPAGEQPSKKRRPTLWIVLAAVLFILIAGGVTTGVIVTNNIHTQQVAAEKAQAKRIAEASAKNEAEAKQAADDAERQQRKTTVTEVEASVKKLAEDDIAKGVLDGPVIDVACNPVSGSTDDLTDPTTTFDCFVANKDNGDGTNSGYFFNATVNWSTGEYTYGLGKSGQ
jgi:hypothetical protein